MTDRRCSHERRVTGILQCDLEREVVEGQPALYSAQIRLHICEECGLIEFHCESHRDVCAWLAARDVGRCSSFANAIQQQE